MFVGLFADLRQAFGLLTILPVRAPSESKGAPGGAMAFYPLVGVFIGAVLIGVSALLSWGGVVNKIPLLPGAILLAVWTGLTGALHLDGWSDCCDALFVPVGRERRLEIMKDPRLGGFGATGLVVLLLVKFAGLQGVLDAPHTFMSLLAVPAVARWTAVVAARSFPSARPGGMGDLFRSGLNARALAIAGLITVAASLPLLWRAAVLWAVAFVVMLTMSFVAHRRLGGLTGDVYGAVVELTETAGLVVVCFL